MNSHQKGLHLNLICRNMDMSKGSGNLKKKILIGCGIFFLIIVIAFTCLIVWFANMIDDSLSKKEIFELVNENYTLL